MNVDVFAHTETNQSFYLIRGIDENYSIMIGELNEDFEKFEKNITSEFLEIYSVKYFFNFRNSTKILLEPKMRFGYLALKLLKINY